MVVINKFGGGGGWNGGTVTNPSTFQSTVNFEQTTTFQSTSVFQNEMSWNMAVTDENGTKQNNGYISEEKMEFGVTETDAFASIVGQSGYEFGAGSANEEHQNGALTYQFSRSAIATERKIVGVTATGVEDVIYNENQSGNLDNDVIYQAIYKGNAVIATVPTETVFGTYTVQMTEVEDSPVITYKWKGIAGTDTIVEFSSNSGRVAGFGIPKLAFALYDFDVNGGTIGDISLIAPQLPDNAVIYDVNWDVLTTLTSATDAATITVGFPTDGNLLTAIAISNPANAWDAGARRPSSVTARKLTAARIPQITVANENVTAGKIMFCFSYWVSS